MATAGGTWGSAPPWATGLPGRVLDFVKSVLLQQLVSPGTSVCDLLCGRGTDTAKWAAAKIGSYVGLDLSSSALGDAEEEWRTLNKPYSASFCQLDPLLGELESKLQDKDLPFDTVCCLKNLQDSWYSEDKVRQLLQNVVSLLKSGGFFFGITADSSTLWSKYQKAVESALKTGALRYGTIPRVKAELYSITFEDDRFNHFGTRYQLRFVDDGFLAPQTQLLVHFPSLIRLAKEAGLEYIEIQNLDEFFEDYRSLFPDVFTSCCSSFLDPRGKLLPQIRDVLSLYTTFIFRKADSYSPGRIYIPVNEEIKDSSTTTISTTIKTSEHKELRAFSRRPNRHLDGEPKKRALFRKDRETSPEETREITTVETKELLTYERKRSKRDSLQQEQDKKQQEDDQDKRQEMDHVDSPRKQDKRIEMEGADLSQKYEDFHVRHTESIDISRRHKSPEQEDDLYRKRREYDDSYRKRDSLQEEHETTRRHSERNSERRHEHRDEYYYEYSREYSPKREDIQHYEEHISHVSKDETGERTIYKPDLRPWDEPPVGGSEWRSYGNGERQKPYMYEYRRRPHRWNKGGYSHHYPSAEELEIQAEMEATQKQLNEPSILGPGPPPILINAYRRDIHKERFWNK